MQIFLIWVIICEVADMYRHVLAVRQKRYGWSDLGSEYAVIQAFFTVCAFVACCLILQLHDKQPDSSLCIILFY